MSALTSVTRCRYGAMPVRWRRQDAPQKLELAADPDGPSGVDVGQVAGQLAVGVGPVDEGLSLGLEELDRIRTGGEPRGRILEPGELDERVGELRWVAALLAIHSLPGRDG